MDRSCKICGFFVDNQTISADNAGYCLYYDEKSNFGGKTGESLKIPDGEEKEIAKKCEAYFREVPSLGKGDFLNWRIGVQTFNVQKRINVITIILTLLATIIACLQLYLVTK